MRTRAKGISRAAVFAAGFAALGVTALPSSAFADVTNGDGGILSGNQVDAPISAPADVSGNGASLLGTTYATSDGGAKIRKRGGAGQKTSGGHGVASGNQVNAPVSLPVNVCGNGAAVLGHADAGCGGGAKVTGGGKNGQVTDGTGGVLAGNQVNAPISVPVNVCGNAVAIAGDAAAGCEGGAGVKNGGHTGSGQETSGVFGVGSGNQANLPISVPVDICGNAAAIVGAAAASCHGQTLVKGSHGSGARTSGEDGAGSGNQANAPVTAPADVCGNAAAVVGMASAVCQDDPGHGGYHPYHRSTGTPLPGTGGLPEVGGLNVADGLITVTGLPSTKELPEVGGAPAHGARSRVDGLPVAGGLSDLGRLPKVNGLLGSVLNPEILRGAGTATPPQGVEGLSSAPVSLLDTRNLSAAGTPGKRTIPGVPGGTVLPSSPVVPSVQNAAAGLPETGALSTPATGVIGPVQPVAAEETTGPKPRAGTTWTVGAAALLAFAAGVLGLTRGIRFGRR
ncbi:chaplin family protein [Actinomadura sp. 3N407]|uniref:chaplin family protein n=1 Tax=Actinomadura sp. 3N407 TaxID=3457423 RepID=UPI003FCDB96B